MQTRYSLWLQASKETAFLLRKLQRITAEDLMTSTASATIGKGSVIGNPKASLSPMPPWMYLVNGEFTPEKSAAPIPFWAFRGENLNDRVIAKNRSSAFFSSPRIDILGEGSLRVCRELLPPFDVIGYELHEKAVGLPDIRRWPIPGGLEKSGDIISRLPTMENIGLFVPLIFFTSSIDARENGAEIFERIEKKMANLRIPPSQRIFSSSTVHALKIEYSRDGRRIEWESMISIDLVQRRRTGV